MKNKGCVLIYAEQEGGKVHPVTYELLGKGRDLANRLKVELAAVLLGEDLEECLLELIQYGADKVYLIEKNTTIGGRMSQLDRTFPTDDCSI